jgi:hypothetical protein
MQTVSFWGTAALTILLPVSAAVVKPAGVPASAPPPSLTIYSGNLALVRQEVDRVLEPGVHTIRVDGLPTNLDHASLIVLNEEATLLGVHSYRSYQDATAGPGASVDIDLNVAKRLTSVQLAFLTTGLNWSADYALLVGSDDRSARVDGYATVVNGSGASYESAEVQLLAGTIQDGGGRYRADDFRDARAMALESAAAPSLEQVAFADYHIYTVSSPLSLRAGESRRIRLLGAGSVSTSKEYIFSHSVNIHQQLPEPLRQPVTTGYRVERPKGSEFGDSPLPAGRVRILKRDEAGRAQLLGIASIPNTPEAEELWLGTGYAFDIVGTRLQTDYKRAAGNVYESAWKIELKNRGDADVTVQVIEQVSGDWRIVESSQPHEKLSAGAVRFMVDVAAGGEAILEYRVSVRT